MRRHSAIDTVIQAALTAAGRSLLPDARAVISRTEEMKTRAVSIAEAGVPQVSIAVDTYFPRAHLIGCLRSLQADFPTVAINLRMTTMLGLTQRQKRSEGPPFVSNSQYVPPLLAGCRAAALQPVAPPPEMFSTSRRSQARRRPRTTFANIESTTPFAEA